MRSEVMTAAYRYRDFLTIVAIPTYDRVVRIAVIGGGPGGLYFAALAKQLGPGHEITVWERNAADDTFGFGVVFSDETLGGIEHADPAIYARDGSASSPAGTTSTSTSAAQVAHRPAATASPR